MMKRLHEKASITVFLSLLLVLFIGFIMMMTEHARIFGLRQRLVCATDSAMDSLFSMYDRELLNEFDLMLFELIHSLGFRCELVTFRQQV